MSSLLATTTTATIDSLPPLDALEDVLSSSPSSPFANNNGLWEQLYPLGFDVTEQRWYATTTTEERLVVQPEAEDEDETRLSSATADVDRFIVDWLTAHEVARHREDDEAEARRRAELRARSQDVPLYVPPSLFEDEELVLALLEQCTFETHVHRKAFVVKPGQTNETCPICFEPYGTSNATTCVFGQCGHHICSECLHKDYATRGLNSCALCRQPIFAPPASGVTLRELVAFAYDFGLDFIELYVWPQRRVYGRYVTRWFFAHLRNGQAAQWWPRDGPWKGSRAHTTLHKRRCVG